MKFNITKTSDYGTVIEVKEFNKIEELLKWVKNTGSEIIIKKIDHKWVKKHKTPQWELEIYDDYRE